jgi:endoglucanase
MKLRSRLCTFASVSVMVLAVSSFATGGAAYAAGGVEIANYGTGKCLTVLKGSTAPHAPVVQEICDGSKGQHWVFNGSPDGIRQVYNLDTGLCLGTTGVDNGSPVMQLPCGEALPGAFWAITNLATTPVRKITLRVYTMSVCLDLPNGNITDGVQLQVWQCISNDINQIFKAY